MAESQTFRDFCVSIQETRPKRSRLGQHAFNVLHEVRPAWAEAIRATYLDPFYSDANLPAFFGWLADNWSTATEEDVSDAAQ